MIYVRNDDILLSSSDWGNPFLRFKEIHEWILAVKKHPVMHIPTILTTEIQAYPECIEYIREETAQGRMQPQLHGVRHIDPGTFGYEGLMDQLKIGREWIQKNLGYTPTRYYTPWGAGEAVGQEWMWKAAAKCNFVMVTCSDINKLNGRFGMVQQLKDGHDPIKFLEGKEIFMHWWQRGQRLQRVLQAIEAGSWEAAHGPVTD